MQTPTIEHRPAKSDGTTSSKHLSKSFYKWHRILGLVALVPVMMWTLSGLLHPLMSNWLRPFIPNERFSSKSQAQMHAALSVKDVLTRNSINAVRNVSLVNFNDSTYYQVLLPDSTYRYYSATSARLLPDGDRTYAIYLAGYFTDDHESKLKQVVIQRQFDDYYQPINRLLPVWKISFLRNDGMDVYVETAQSRLGTFNNTTRKSMLSIFRQLHTWGFLSIFGEGFRIAVLLCIVSIMLFTLISGLIIYGLLWNRFKSISKSQNTSSKRIAHKFHRQLGLIVSLVMFTFVISAAFHLLVKLHNLSPQQKQYSQVIKSSDLTVSNLKLPVPDSLIQHISLAAFENQSWYQVLTTKKQLRYFNTKTGQELLNGDGRYATWLANYYKSQQHASAKPLNIVPIKQFTTEYGFVNKRLPVEKISYPNHEDWYIETSSAKLATTVAGLDRAEGFSFIFLHKYFGMTWAGKDIRDIVSMLAAAGILVTSIFGFIAFLKAK